MKNPIWMMLIAVIALAGLLGCSDCPDCPDCPGDSAAPPVVSVVGLADGDTLSGRDNVIVRIEASSPTSTIERVNVRIDDYALSDSPDFVTPFEFVWACSLSSMGEHLISATATTYEGQTGITQIGVHLGYCEELEVRGILYTDENRVVYGGDISDWSYETEGAVGAHRVFPAYPNPTRGGGSVKLEFGLSVVDSVSYEIYDDHCNLLRIIRTGLRPAGQDFVMWDGSDGDGNPLPNGIYGCTVKIGDSEGYGDIQINRD